MLRFSVVMPAYNREHLIGPAIESILAQQFPDYEIIVVDDQSTDQTVQVARAFGERVKVIEQKNAGPGAARNRAVQAAKGQYVAFLDSDDLWFPWTLETYNQIISQNHAPAFIVTPSTYFEQPSELGNLAYQKLELTTYLDYFSTSDISFLTIPTNVLVKRQAFLDVGGFNPQKVNQEDCDLWLKLGTQRGFVLVQQPVCSAIRKHDQNVSHETDRNVQGVQYLIKQFKQNKYPDQKTRRKDCLKILTRHIRPACIACLRLGQLTKAWQFYRQSFGWNLVLGRFKFLIAAPLLVIKHMLLKR